MTTCLSYLRIVLFYLFTAPLNYALADNEPEFTTEVAVHTGKILKTTLHRYVLAYGIVEPEPASDAKPAASAKIAVPVPGILAQIHCYEGQQVKKGSLLFELDNRSNEALIAKAKVAAAFAEKNFARKQQLNSTDNISRKLYDEAEQLLQTALEDLSHAQIQAELLRIRAPLTAMVTAVHFKVGEAMSQNTVLAELIAMDRLDIAMRLPSLEAAEIRLGQAVDFSLSSDQDGKPTLETNPLHGSVTFIGATVDPLTDTILIRASLKADSGLRPGQFVKSRILVEERPERLAAPIASVLYKQGSSKLALVQGDSAKLISIKSGLKDGNLVEVESNNLHVGDTIVTEGVYGLPAETRIRVLQ